MNSSFYEVLFFAFSEKRKKIFILDIKHKIKHTYTKFVLLNIFFLLEFYFFGDETVKKCKEIKIQIEDEKKSRKKSLLE